MVVLLGQQLISWHYNKTFTDDEIETLFKPITAQYGIKIIHKVGSDFFSPIDNPPIPAGPGRHSKVKTIRHRNLASYPGILDRALKRYPIAVVKNYLNGIQFAGQIDEGGLKYGGTYDPFRKRIYLVNDGRQTDYDAMYTLHHEFSSLLLKSHSFYINPWTNNNPSDFQYLYEKYKSWKELEGFQISHEEKNENYEKGFMNTYGQTNFENDFNEYSAMIFTYPHKFKKIMNQYPRVRKKFLVWLEFYQKIDPVFTEKYLFGNNE